MTEPGDFALHQKGVYHSGEEIRQGGGIDLEFAIPYPGVHNGPTGYWSLARDNPVQSAASWTSQGKVIEVYGEAAMASVPATAARYRARTTRLPDYAAREVYLAPGTVLPLGDERHDRLPFVLSGHLRLTTTGKAELPESEDVARVERGTDVRIEALDEVKYAEASVPPLPGK